MSEQQQFQATMVALVRAFGWHRPMSTPCGKPVPIAEAHALMELEKQRVLTQHELTIRLNLSKSTVSRLVGNIVKRGWVERSRNATDGRVSDLRLTDAGHKAAAEMEQAREQKIAGVLGAISAENRPQLIKNLNLLLEAIHESSQ
ncbi:MAG: MarR family winged helix-turn-helix transcriptional regulator [Candidatus Promineifilaceae bacterium]